MTKAKAFALAKYLNAHCDEAHIFVCKIGSGCLCDVKTCGDAHELLTMFFTLIDRTMENLKAKERDDFYKLLAHAMKMYIDEEFKPKQRKENLSDKLRRKRVKSNEKIISAVEEILSQGIDD